MYLKENSKRLKIYIEYNIPGAGYTANLMSVWVCVCCEPTLAQVKSKVRRSEATREPCWLTGPKTCERAHCSMWVAEWFRMHASRWSYNMRDKLHIVQGGPKTTMQLQQNLQKVAHCHYFTASAIFNPVKSKLYLVTAPFFSFWLYIFLIISLLIRVLWLKVWIHWHLRRKT